MVLGMVTSPNNPWLAREYIGPKKLGRTIIQGGDVHITLELSSIENVGGAEAGIRKANANP